MKKVLIVETNVAHYGNTDKPTGLWLGESVEFVADMQKANIAVDYVSPKGGFVPLDPRSMKYTTPEIMQVYETNDFIERGMCQTLKPSEVNPDDYFAIYYTGGHGVMWDFPDDQGLQKIAEAIYQKGGYLLSVCHGIAGLFNLTDAQGNYLIQNKQVTGFTTAEEIIAGKQNVVPFLNQAMATKRGAKFTKKRFYSEFAIQDGRLITGQNPFSAHAVAKRFLAEVQ
ncbi:type 1 glutamine amidotransferase domain-containing protein [Fructilactobacillus vespulae]|uniref:type 1 glutamine amidotransferase domain-containing protein n=1 Tax=Fructilactobacillus vespulae TaxID=1249630 RepID=UPI0039B401CA